MQPVTHVQLKATENCRCRFNLASEKHWLIKVQMVHYHCIGTLPMYRFITNIHYHRYITNGTLPKVYYLPMYCYITNIHYQWCITKGTLLTNLLVRLQLLSLAHSICTKLYSLTLTQSEISKPEVESEHVFGCFLLFKSSLIP